MNKDYKLILNDRQDLTDYERQQLIPELNLRLKAMRQHFVDIIELCDVQKNSPAFNQAIKPILNPKNMQTSIDGFQGEPSEKFFSDIKNQAQDQGIDDIDRMLEENKEINTVSQLGLFTNDLNNFCSCIVGLNNKLFFYKMEVYPQVENLNTGEAFCAKPHFVSVTIEPFQICVGNIVGIAKATSETIHEWHKYTQKLKTQYLDLSIKHVELKNNKFVLFIQVLSIVLAFALSSFFLTASDPLNLYKKNLKIQKDVEVLNQEKSILETSLNKSQELIKKQKQKNKKRITNHSTGQN